jgi:hypothetical protein
MTLVVRKCANGVGYFQELEYPWRKYAADGNLLTSDPCSTPTVEAAPYAPPPSTTGGAGSQPAPVNVGGCSECRKASATLTTPAAPATVTGPAAVVRPAARVPWPWWVFVLAMLVLAGVVQRE